MDNTNIIRKKGVSTSYILNKCTLACATVLVMGQLTVQAGNYDVVVKLVTGAAAVFGLANSAEAVTIHNQQDDVVRDLKARGLNPRNGAIYQIYFYVDPKAAHRWILSPNVYALVQLEGQGDYVPASIAKGYQGQEISLTIYGRQVRPGGTILVHILDDKTFWNTAWNSLLQTEVNFNVASVVVTPCVQSKFDASGRLQLLNKDITFEPPGYMASAKITVPQTQDGVWLMDGTLVDVDKQETGKLRFCQVWRADPSLLSNLSNSTWRIAFWGGFGVVMLAVFASQFKKQSQRAG